MKNSVLSEANGAARARTSVFTATHGSRASVPHGLPTPPLIPFRRGGECVRGHFQVAAPPQLQLLIMHVEIEDPAPIPPRQAQAREA